VQKIKEKVQMDENLEALYRAKRVLVAQCNKSAQAGNFEPAILPLIRRRPEEISEAQEIAGDTQTVTGVWCVTLPDRSSGTRGGNVHRASLDRACEFITFRPHAIRFATKAEIDGQLASEQQALDQRIDGARRLSYREDSTYGKRA
jgi:hypothetical protein